MKKLTNILCLVSLFLLMGLAGPAFALGSSEDSSPESSAGKVPETPQRIVMAGKAIFMVADAVYLFPDAPDRVLSAGIDYQGQGAFLSLLDETYAEKMTLPRTVSPEEIAALKPDHVILKAQMKERLGQPLSQWGIPVTYLDLESPETYRRDIVRLGELLGQLDRAREVLAALEDRVSRVNEALQGEKGANPRVLFLSYASSEGTGTFTVPDAQWMQTRLITMAGGQPVWTGEGGVQGRGWTRVTPDQIALWQPDEIFVVSYRGNSREAVQAMKDSPLWQSLLDQGARLRAVPGDFYSWDQPDMRWVLGLEWFAAALHPGAFPSYKPQEAAAAFYQDFYGFSREEFEELLLPRLQAGLE